MITVVIPLYNKAHMIMRTLASVLTQTYKDFEVLIVNDGSTDDSVHVINSFTSDPRVKIVEQKNQGVSVARNTGVAHAKYDYVAFLDADDEWLPGYLEKLKEAIELFPDASMYGFPSWHRNILTGQAGNTTLNRYKNKIQLVEYFENPHTMPHTSAMTISKRFFNMLDNGHGFPVGKKLCEDWSCFNRIAFLGEFVYIGFPLGIRNNGVPGQITGIKKEGNSELMQGVVDFFNLTHAFSLNYPNKARLFKIFFRYDLRNRILNTLRDKDYVTLKYYLDHLSKECLKELNSLEIKLYQTRFLNIFAKLYVYITKLIWRTHGFPIVGKPD